MNVREKEFTCTMCGAKYVTRAKHTMFCPKCREIHRKRANSSWCKKNRTSPMSEARKKALEEARLAKKAKDAEERRLDSEALETAHNACRDFCLSSLFSAKEKPAWCSDVRWRIELRRRKNAMFYKHFGSQS